MIERKDRNNISLRDCEKVSRSLSTLIDVGDVISDQYTLEISSPGVERKLNSLKDYERFTGQDALIQLRVPINNVKKIRCTIRGITKDKRIKFLCLDDTNSDDHLINMSLQDIEKANILAP
jgi:ribosome maturation factor RimP